MSTDAVGGDADPAPESPAGGGAPASPRGIPCRSGRDDPGLADALVLRNRAIDRRARLEGHPGEARSPAEVDRRRVNIHAMPMPSPSPSAPAPKKVQPGMPLLPPLALFTSWIEAA